jgi:hypothetical protein
MKDPKISEAAAAAMQAALQGTSSVEFLDLGAVDAERKNLVESRFTIPYTGYIAIGSKRCAKEIATAATKRPLPSPTPASLIISKAKDAANTLYGVPTMETSPSFLTLEWEEKGRQVRTNMMNLLQALQIAIPAGTRMAIKVKHLEHPELKHCVALSWDQDCFLPMDEAAETKEQ